MDQKKRSPVDGSEKKRSPVDGSEKRVSCLWIRKKDVLLMDQKKTACVDG